MGVLLHLQIDVHVGSVRNALIHLILVSNTIGMLSKSILVHLENVMRLADRILKNYQAALRATQIAPSKDNEGVWSCK